jgi:hypothetical protein
VNFSESPLDYSKATLKLLEEGITLFKKIKNK